MKPFVPEQEEQDQEEAKDGNSAIFFVENEQTGTGKWGNRRKGSTIHIKETIETNSEIRTHI